MKKVEFQYTENGITKIAGFKLNGDFPKAAILAKEDFLISSLKKSIPNAENICMLVEINNPQISKKVLLEKVGPEVASGWGAECTSVKAYKNMVVFKCIECGERFETSMTYDEIKKDYKNLLR